MRSLYWSVAILPCVAVVSGPIFSMQVPTDDDVRTAIEFGTSNAAVEPYLLRSAFVRAKRPVGVVYTPFIRVALAARHAAATGSTVSPDSLPAEAREPTVDIVMADQDRRGEQALEEWQTSEPPYEMYIEGPRNGAAQAEIIRALRIVHQLDELPPALLGLEKPGVVTAAFPLFALQRGERVVLRRRWRKPGGGFLIWQSVGIIPKDEVSRWR